MLALKAYCLGFLTKISDEVLKSNMIEIQAIISQDKDRLRLSLVIIWLSEISLI